MLIISIAFDYSQDLDYVHLHKTCPVQFNLYILLKWNRFPFLLLITRGRHTHHPFYSTKLPKDIANEVIDAIKKQEYLDLTVYIFCICETCAKLILTYVDCFIISSQFAVLNKKYSDYTLYALHLSLNIKN